MNKTIKAIVFIAVMSLSSGAFANECFENTQAIYLQGNSNSMDSALRFVESLSIEQKEKLKQALAEEPNEDDYEEVDVDAVEASAATAPSTFPTVTQ